MTTNAFFHLTRADFLQRIRSNSFFIMVVLIVYISYLFVPPATANYETIVIGQYRLLYNSAGIGLMFGLVISLFFSLFAFYLVKNSVERDRSTHVGQIIATTPTHTVTYLVGKWGSNMLLLAVLVVIMTLMAPVMQWLRGESAVFDWWQIVLPIWLIGLPTMSLIAGTAVLFETIRFLRGGFGNIAYFFLWSLVMIGVAMSTFESGNVLPEPFGISTPVHQIYSEVTDTDQEFKPDLTLIGEKAAGESALWELTHNDWPADAVFWRLFWFVAGIAFASLGALPFDRFNPANARGSQSGRVARYWQGIQEKRRQRAVRSLKPAPSHLSRLPGDQRAFRFGGVLLAESKLTLNGQPWWWYAGAVGFFIYGLTQPMATSKSFLMVAMIWPVLVWSALGAREKQNHTMAFIWTTPRPLWRQIPAAWLSGVAVSLLVFGGYIVNVGLHGAWLPLLGLLTGALFVPALAIALGVLTGTPRSFEVVYLAWWYVAMNLEESAFLNFMPVANKQAVPIYLAAAALLLVVAIVGRAINK